MSPFHLSNLQIQRVSLGLALSSSFTRRRRFESMSSAVCQWRSRAPLLFQQGLPSISPCSRRRWFVWVITEAAGGVGYVETQRLGASQGSCATGWEVGAVGAEDASRWRVMMISIEVPVSTWHNLSFLVLLFLSANDAGEKYQHQCGELGERETGREERDGQRRLSGTFLQEATRGRVLIFLGDLKANKSTLLMRSII